MTGSLPTGRPPPAPRTSTVVVAALREGARDVASSGDGEADRRLAVVEGEVEVDLFGGVLLEQPVPLAAERGDEPIRIEVVDRFSAGTPHVEELHEQRAVRLAEGIFVGGRADASEPWTVGRLWDLEQMGRQHRGRGGARPLAGRA